MYYLGQICGLIGTLITILQPQFRKKEQILICGILVNGLNAFNFALIGHGGTSVYLCLVAIAQSLVAIRHGRKNTDVTQGENILFFFLYVGFGLWGMISAPDFVWAMSWENALNLLPILGALMLMLSVFAKGEQRTRGFLFLNASAWLVYSAIIGSTVVFSSIIAMTSSGLALWKYRKK